MEPCAFNYSLRVRLKKANSSFFGPGVADLLRLVDQTGSLQTAAATMQMSYSKAWKIVRTAEKELGFSMMERHVGGAGGGSSQLTEQGRSFIERYERFQREIYQTADKLFDKYFSGDDQTI
ncbi:LysR family transcriptional regulator [Oscillospiraceae bacterium PP1C4]